MSNTIDTSRMLAELRAMSSQAGAGVPAADKIQPTEMVNGLSPTQRVEKAEQVDFQSLLKSAIDQVNSIQSESGQIKQDFIMGKDGVDLAQVMIASEKSSVAFTALVETRNKLLTAYQEIMRMPV